MTIKALYTRLSLLIVFCCSEPSILHASLSLHQDEKGLNCAGKNLTFSIDKRDENLDLIKLSRKNKRLKMKSAKFLGEGAVFVPKKQGAQPSTEAALFHLLENEQAQILIGQRYLMRERRCTDTGASKTCKSNEVKKLYWSPEQLSIELKETQQEIASRKLKSSVVRYGTFQKEATYFYGENAALIDFGSDFWLFIGQIYQVNCRYTNGRKTKN